eukprot:4625553-Lingulodinium_polyedra.AAC.1
MVRSSVDRQLPPRVYQSIDARQRHETCGSVNVTNNVVPTISYVIAAHMIENNAKYSTNESV